MTAIGPRPNRYFTHWGEANAVLTDLVVNVIQYVHHMGLYGGEAIAHAVYVIPNIPVFRSVPIPYQSTLRVLYNELIRHVFQRMSESLILTDEGYYVLGPGTWSKALVVADAFVRRCRRKHGMSEWEYVMGWLGIEPYHRVIPNEAVRQVEEAIFLERLGIPVD